MSPAARSIAIQATLVAAVAVIGVLGVSGWGHQCVLVHEPVEVLLERLREPDPVLWKETVRQLASDGANIVPDLIEALDDRHRAVREGAAHALGDIGPDAAPAVDALIRTFEDEDDYVRWKVARALGRIGHAAAAAIPMLEAAVNAERETELMRATAQRALEQIRGAK